MLLSNHVNIASKKSGQLRKMSAEKRSARSLRRELEKQGYKMRQKNK